MWTQLQLPEQEIYGIIFSLINCVAFELFILTEVFKYFNLNSDCLNGYDHDFCSKLFVSFQCLLCSNNGFLFVNQLMRVSIVELKQDTELTIWFIQTKQGYMFVYIEKENFRFQPKTQMKNANCIFFSKRMSGWKNLLQRNWYIGLL